MEVLTINGKEFVKASIVAKELGYAQDYVGQLARSGAVHAERVGRAWYVDKAEVAAHKKEKRRSVAVRARAGLVDRVRLVQHANDAVRPILGISYHEDDSPLMPEIVRSEDMSTQQSAEEETTEEIGEVTVRDELYNIPEPEVIEVAKELEEVTEAYRVPIRQANKEMRFEVKRERFNIPYEGYEVSQKKLPPESKLPTPSISDMDVKYISNLPYILLTGFSILALFIGMYSYVDGAVTKQGEEKMYKVSTTVISELSKK